MNQHSSNNSSNSGDSFDSSSSSNGGDSRGLPRSSRPLLWDPNSEYERQIRNRMFAYDIHAAANGIATNGFRRSSAMATATAPTPNQSIFPLNRINKFGENGMVIEEGCDFVSKWATTITGCEYLQRFLAEEDDGGMKEKIITKVTADLPILMVHQIGFKFAKTVFNSCNEQQISRVLQSIVVGNEFNFVNICNNYFGKEAVKTLIENLKIKEHVLTVTNVLIDHICSFTNFYHARQVIEFFIQACNVDFTNRLIFNAMARNCVAIATNQFGCVVLQHCICPVYIKGDFMSSLLNSIVFKSDILAEDRFGNYVLQRVISTDINNVTRGIVERLTGKFSDLARSKCGSNVVEKCLVAGELNDVVKIVVELTNSIHLPAIAQDPFGNYVLQFALEQALHRGTGEVYSNLVKGIIAHSSILQTHLYGTKVLYKIHKLNVSFKN